MIEILHPPDAQSLLESLRSIGYSLESALADLADNSISAKAKNIRIEFGAEGFPYVATIDDGEGMTKAVLQDAMRHGSTNPLEARAADDLGRYGLGLKTSSISQCRRVTVISLRHGELSAFCWDLDIVAHHRAWVMLELEKDDISALPYIDVLQRQKKGTIVLWQSLDLLSAGESSISFALGHKMDRAREHMSLVFHRFIAPEPGRTRVSFFINNSRLLPTDPFMLNHTATQALDEDTFTVEGKRIVVKPYILPHISKLSASEVVLAGGSGGLRSQQGFYVYRNRRLIIWGSWFRLAKKDELSKLARVRVDIPNSLDHLWTLDIKKSIASPPEAVRTNLRRTIERIRKASGRTLAYRGRATDRGDFTPVWNEVRDRDGVRFDINRQHPVIAMIANRLSANDASAFSFLLALIECSFPAESLYSSMAADVRPAFDNHEVMQKLTEMAASIFSGLSGSPNLRQTLMATLHLIEPFNAHPATTRRIIEEMENQ